MAIESQNDEGHAAVPAPAATRFEDAAHEERCALLSARLRAGLAVMDSELDSLYELAHRSLSSTFWTPVEVARTIAAGLVARPGMRVLDIGSGVGKFCVVGALSTSGEFVGVEHRAHLVEQARAVAARLGADRARFHATTFETLDPASFDAVYMFNPFDENRWGSAVGIDKRVELSIARFARDVHAARQFLSGMRPEARVATYYGFGGVMPASYRLLERTRFGAGNLELWEQTANADEGGA